MGPVLYHLGVLSLRVLFRAGIRGFLHLECQVVTHGTPNLLEVTTGPPKGACIQDCWQKGFLAEHETQRVVRPKALRSLHYGVTRKRAETPSYFSNQRTQRTPSCPPQIRSEHKHGQSAQPLGHVCQLGFHRSIKRVPIEKLPLKWTKRRCSVSNGALFCQGRRSTGHNCPVGQTWGDP